MKVRVDSGICEICYYSSKDSEGCGYMDETGHSRLRDENGNRYDPQYCDKYKEGKKGHGESWKKLQMGNYKK